MTRFSLAGLIMFLTMAAVCVWLSREDWLVGTGVALAVCLALVSLRGSNVRNRSSLVIAGRWMSGLLAALVAWFSLVDRSQFLEECPSCFDHHSIEELRIGGVALLRKKHYTHESFLSRLQADLGYPCAHDFARQHQSRSWGLLITARPSSGGTCCLSGDMEFYNDVASKNAQAFGRQNPQAARDVIRKAIYQRDHDALREFIVLMRGETLY